MEEMLSVEMNVSIKTMELIVNENVPQMERQCVCQPNILAMEIVKTDSLNVALNVSQTTIELNMAIATAETSALEVRVNAMEHVLTDTFLAEMIVAGKQKSHLCC